MVTTYMFNRIRELYSQGMKERAIARELGLDRKTVGRYLKLNAPPRYNSLVARLKPRNSQRLCPMKGRTRLRTRSANTRRQALLAFPSSLKPMEISTGYPYRRKIGARQVGGQGSFLITVKTQPGLFRSA